MRELPEVLLRNVVNAMKNTGCTQEQIEDVIRQSTMLALPSSKVYRRLSDDKSLKYYLSRHRDLVMSAQVVYYVPDNGQVADHSTLGGFDKLELNYKCKVIDLIARYTNINHVVITSHIAYRLKQETIRVYYTAKDYKDINIYTVKEPNLEKMIRLFHGEEHAILFDEHINTIGKEYEHNGKCMNTWLHQLEYKMFEVIGYVIPAGYTVEDKCTCMVAQRSIS